jgi:hypothetical protein
VKNDVKFFENSLGIEGKSSSTSSSDKGEPESSKDSEECVCTTQHLAVMVSKSAGIFSCRRVDDQINPPRNQNRKHGEDDSGHLQSQREKSPGKVYHREISK